jgi:hypothetical protein
MQKRLPILLCLSLFLSGCASVTLTHVNDNDTSDGVHFYEPRPYLLVSKEVKKDANGKEENQFTNQIIWFPDHSRRYLVKVHSGWGTVNGSVKLQNGWMLDTLGAQMDSKIPETITAISGLVKEAGALASAPGPGLYRIDIDEKGEVALVKQEKW